MLMRFFFLPHLFRVFFDFSRVHPIALFHPSLGIWIGRRRRVLFRLLFHHHVCVCVCLIIDLLYYLSRRLKKRFWLKASSNQKILPYEKSWKKGRNAQNIFSYLLPDASSFTAQILRVEYTRALEYTNTKQYASSSLRRLYRVGKVSLRSLRRREGAFYVRVIRRKSLHFYRRR